MNHAIEQGVKKRILEIRQEASKMFPGGPGNASEAYYSYVIQQALSSLKKVLGMDYAGIWIKSGEHLIPVNETGVSDYINEAVISGQIKEADTDTRKTGKYFYLCASESNNGGVDAVFTFRTTESEPFGYLLLDDVDNARELSNEETESVCKVFFESLYVLLIERDNASLRRENSALRNQMEQVANVSKIDSTTGLMNKKTFDDSLKGRFRQIAGSPALATFGLVTIDGFQKISMEKGDFVTDSVVQRISEIISMGYFKDGVSYVRRSVDEFARIASGTFAFHFPSEAAEDSEKRLKSLVDIISKHASFREMDGSRFRVSISVRYVSIPGEMLPVPDTGSIEGVSPGYYAPWSDLCINKLSDSARVAIPSSVASISPDFLPNK